MDLGTLSVQLETNLKRFSADMRKSVEVVDHSCTEIQKSVEEETKTTTELRDRFFKATHNNLQNDLYSHDQYFNNLRDKWADNESMLTQINITANAEREKILKEHANSVTNVMNKLKSVLRLGFATYAINSFMDIGSSMLEAKRNGESMFDAFLSGLPIINRMADSAKRLAKEMSGLAAIEVITQKSLGITTEYENIFTQLNRINKLMAAGADAAALQAKFEYEDTLQEIEALDRQADAIRKRNQAIDDIIAKGKVIGVGFGGGKTISPYSESEIESMNSQKLALQNFDLLRAKALDEYNAKLKAATEEQEEITIQSQNEITNATIRMYQDLGQYPQEYFDLQEELLQKQVKAYTDAGGDIILAEQWKASEMKRIADDVAEYKKQKEYKDALSSDDFGAGFSAEVSKMYDEMETLGELGANLGRTMKEGLVNSLTDAILEAKSLNDALREVGLSMARMAMQWAMNQVVTSGLNAAFGVAASDKGNIFNSGDIVPFALGGIVNRPAMFSMPNGRLGSIAEVAPEAIMPLKRTSGGKLGVETSGGQSNYQPQIKVVIVRNEQEAFEEYLNSARGEKVLLKKQAKNQKYFS